MSIGADATDALAKFAAAHGLAALEPAPAATPLSGHEPVLARAYSGTLPGGAEGWVGWFSYVRRSDDHSTTIELTIAGTSIPESIGFAPYLAYADAAEAPGEVRQFELADGDLSVVVYAGVSDPWLTQLFSPALTEWLSRSAEDFTFQLSGGNLCAARKTHLADAAQLESLCKDTAFLASAVAAESIESSESGTTGSTAARHKPVPEDAWMENALAAIELPRPPADVAEARPAFAKLIGRNPATLVYLLWRALWITLLINVPGIAVPILLIADGSVGPLIAIELALLALVYFACARSHVRKASARAAAEAFYRGYAKRREMRLEDPLAFSAEHAEAKLPFAPERVLSGPLAGLADASLVWKGDGTKREDRIALVAGRRGPVVSAELRAEPPGLGDTELDGYEARLGAELGAHRQ